MTTLPLYDFLTVSQLAERLKITKDEVKKKIKAGEIKAQLIGNQIIIKKTELERIHANNKQIAKNK